MSSMSWLELILEQSLETLWDEVMLLREVWMLVIWMFISINFNSDTSDRISRRWLRSRILFPFSFISCHIPIFNQCSTYVETRELIFTSKRFGKHLWKSGILYKDAGRWPASLIKMPFFHRCFSNVLLVKTTTWFIHKWNIGRKWVKVISLKLSIIISSFEI